MLVSFQLFWHQYTSQNLLRGNNETAIFFKAGFHYYLQKDLHFHVFKYKTFVIRDNKNNHSFSGET